jgi:spermidine synthase
MKTSSVKKVETFLFLTGFVSILGQIVLLRELNITFRGIELVYTLAFSAWLVGTALGVSVGKRNYAPPDSRIIILFLLIGLLFPLDLFFIRNLHILFGGIAGSYLPFGKQIISMFTALLPVSIIAGILFQWVAKRYVASAKTLAGAYAIESLGGLIGGGVSSLLIMAGLQNFEITLICSIVCLAAFVINIDSTQYRYIASFILLVLVTGSLFYNKSMDNWMTSEGYGRKVESIDTPYNRITIASSHNQVSIFDDNALSYETETFEAEEFVQLASLQSVNPDHVLVLGGGFKGIIEQFITLPVAKIDYVEYNRKMYWFIKDHLPEKLKNSLSSEKVNIIFEDPRLYLGKKIRYDIILSGMPEPASGQNSRFYTKEFFEEISSCLNKKGIFAFNLPSSENFWTPALQKRNASIYKSLKAVFKDIVVLPGTSNIFIASNDLLIKDPVILSERLRSRKIQNKLVTPEYINYIYKNDRFNEISGLLNDSTAAINTDIKPICYQYTLTIWFSKFFPGAEQWDFILTKVMQTPLSKMLLGFLIFILILVGRKWKTFRRSFIVFIAGFQGMVLEIILLLNYQMHNGILFQNIGILIMGFMLGLASGAWIVNKFIKMYTGFLLITSSIIIYLIFGVLINVGNINTFFITLISLVISGFLTSGIFAFASRFKVADQKKIISPLYSADLLGGVAGSVLANFIFVPVLGFGTAAQFMAFPSLLLYFFL